MILSVLLTIAALASGADTALKPARTLPEPAQAGWMEVAAVPGAPGWLLCGTDTVWSYQPPSPPAPLVRSKAEGGSLQQPMRVGASREDALVFDNRTLNLIQAKLATGKATGATPASKAGGPPFGGIAWNGKRWILSGSLKDGSGSPLEIQAREAGSFALAGGMALRPDERSVTGILMMFGSVAGGPGGKSLVSVQCLTRAVVVDEAGREVLSIELPIPEPRRMLDSARLRPISSPESYEADYRGRTVPMGVGWNGDRPGVLLVDLGAGENAVRWCEFSSRDGSLIRETRLALPSRHPHDFFSAALSMNGASASLLVLSSPWEENPAKRTRTLYEFNLKAAP